MRLLTLLHVLLLLAACNTPGPHFRGLTATRVMVEGSVFDVRLRDELAEAVRLNVEYAPRFGPVRDRAAAAMAAVSGCRVTDVLGDQALATGRLDCSSGRNATLSLCDDSIPLAQQARASPDGVWVCIPEH